MTVKEQLIERIKAMPEGEAERWLERLVPPEEPSSHGGLESRCESLASSEEADGNGPRSETGSSSPDPPTIPTVSDPSLHALISFLREGAENAPDEEVDRLPSDLSENLDHYLYGSPKR